MKAWIRVADASKQPQLRLAVEGRLDGQIYYRRMAVGSSDRPAEVNVPQLTTDWVSYTIALTDLPESGLTGLCVGFDLMSEGEVWIDDVQVLSLWLSDEENKELMKTAPTAVMLARTGQLNECRLLVEGYWPSFLRRAVQLPDARDTVPPLPGTTAAVGAPAIGAQPKEQNWLERTAERNKKWWQWMRIR
jgi:hypothetical protein